MRVISVNFRGMTDILSDTDYFLQTILSFIKQHHNSYTARPNAGNQYVSAMLQTNDTQHCTVISSIRHNLTVASEYEINK
jgi:hypothetical protein